VSEIVVFQPPSECGKFLTFLPARSILESIENTVGSPAARAERKAQAFDPYDLIRIMPAEGSGFKT
jgi:hypothetical protein